MFLGKKEDMRLNFWEQTILTLKVGSRKRKEENKWQTYRPAEGRKTFPKVTKRQRKNSLLFLLLIICLQSREEEKLLQKKKEQKRKTKQGDVIRCHLSLALGRLVAAKDGGIKSKEKSVLSFRLALLRRLPWQKRRTTTKDKNTEIKQQIQQSVADDLNLQGTHQSCQLQLSSQAIDGFSAIRDSLATPQPTIVITIRQTMAERMATFDRYSYAWLAHPSRNLNEFVLFSIVIDSRWQVKKSGKKRQFNIRRSDERRQ